MNKRYQVFVSSTFADLQDERSKVIQTLMEMDCIPAGMELFPAMDEEQFEFIKKIIDDCDYYLLIIGARYGSISEDDGLSYTEKEYRYAKEKGMKVIALVHGEPDQLAVAKTDRDPALYDKLVAFRNDVCTDRLVRFWHSAVELPGLVALSLPKTIKAYPAIGWVRGDATASPSLMAELLAVKNENERLRAELSAVASKSQVQIQNIAGLDTLVSINGSCYKQGDIKTSKWKYDFSLSDVFKLTAPYILSPQADINVRKYMGRQLFNASLIQGTTPTISETDFQTIKIQFEALGLIELTGDSNVLFWSLTSSGKQQMTELVALRK
ncbi:DUF4062 domain-containing protein [Aeromonas caviae]|uniref:DUF4062 domain-containing protein n=2 Tax=Aeromonas caviae TaxID=648 RepID=UPI003014A28D